jgi:hypothetical protein
MSLSKPRGTTSPVQRRFELKLAAGSVTYYDSDAKDNVVVTGPAGAWEEGKQYEADSPFKVIVLDVLSVIGGYSDAKSSGIWSNEVRSTRNEEFVVKTRDGVLRRGLYEEIKDVLKGDGGKFGNSIYLAYNDGGEWRLGNVKLIGAGVSAFFDFKKGKSFDRDPGLAIIGWEGMKKGSNKYFSPIFESWQVGEADLESAIALDEDLQRFLSSSVGAKDDQDEPPQAETVSGNANFDEEPPF